LPVNISNSLGETVVEFGWDFNISTLDLSKVTVITDPVNGTGSVR